MTPLFGVQGNSPRLNGSALLTVENDREHERTALEESTGKWVTAHGPRGDGWAGPGMGILLTQCIHSARSAACDATFSASTTTRILVLDLFHKLLGVLGGVVLLMAPV